MTIKIAINGYGRIGRNVLRAIYELRKNNLIKIVAINDTGNDLQVHTHLTKHDSVHGLFNYDVNYESNYLIINQDKIKFLSERNPLLLPWAELNVDVVLECSGVFNSKLLASAHLKSGAKKVLLSAPGESDIDFTVVYGVNHHLITKEMTVISNASCTTNCLAPIAMILDNSIGIEKGFMTTIHSYTNDQKLTDAYHKDIRRTRASMMSMIPTKTGAAKAVALVLPQLKDKLDGIAIRIPTPNVSLIDFTFVATCDTNVNEVNQLIIDSTKNKLKGIMRTSVDPLVSIDFNHDSHSSIFDLNETKVKGNLVKVYSWYDNEWAFSCRMTDVVLNMMDKNNGN